MDVFYASLRASIRDARNRQFEKLGKATTMFRLLRDAEHGYERCVWGSVLGVFGCVELRQPSLLNGRLESNF
jgi:hypothetical protein